MKVLRPRAHRSASCCKAHCALGTGECHCCRRPAPRLSAAATARPMSSKVGLGFKGMDFRTPQTHLPDQVRSSIPQGLGCRASCLKTQALGRDLQTRDSLNPCSLGETVAGALSTVVRHSCREGPRDTAEGNAVATGHGLQRFCGWGDSVARGTCRR